MSARTRPTRKQRPANDEPGAEGGGDAEYRELIQVVRDMLANERLHVPPRLTEAPVVLPLDLTTVSDKELQQLYTAFAAYSYRAGYLLLEHEAMAFKCKQIADEIVTQFMSQHGDEYKTVTAGEAVAEQNEEVKKWRKRQRTNGVLADAQRKQRDNYDKVCERLSRLETMRMNEFERSGNRLASRSGFKK